MRPTKQLLSQPGVASKVEAMPANRNLFDCAGWRAFIMQHVLEDERARATLH